MHCLLTVAAYLVVLFSPVLLAARSSRKVRRRG